MFCFFLSENKTLYKIFNPPTKVIEYIIEQLLEINHSVILNFD